MTDTSQMDMYNKIAAVKKTILRHPNYDNALETINETFRMRKSAGVCENLFCIGPSGTGKSTLKKQLKAKHPPVEMKDRILRPFLSCDTPSKPTIGNMAEELLQEMGDPNYAKGTVAHKTNRVSYLLDKLDVQVVILDEMQHFVDHGNKRSAAEVSDWLKRLIDKSNACFVLMGLERAEDILRANEQLRRRFSRQIKLPPFSIERKSDAATFARVIGQLDSQIGLANRIELTPSLVKQIHYATNGVMDHIVKLMLGAFSVCNKSGVNTITRQTLQQAFTNNIWDDGVGKMNPFSDKFCWLRLDKPGMPFYNINHQ